MAEPSAGVRAAFTFACDDAELVGVLDRPAGAPTRGALIVVGGPQYRVGSHRQFTLLARDLSAAGYAAMRFDHRGIGDSSGEPAGFEALDDDIRSAVDAFLEAVPGLEEVVWFGLCDAASAAMMYVPSDPRIKGLVVLNPWVRSEAGLARSTIRQYYAGQLMSRDFWTRLFTGEVRVGSAAVSLVRTVVRALGGRRGDDATGTSTAAATRPFQERMCAGFASFRGPILVVLSGDDLTATEFEGLVRSRRAWRKAMARRSVTIQRLPEASHTFSTRAWRDQVAAWTSAWMGSW